MSAEPLREDDQLQKSNNTRDFVRSLGRPDRLGRSGRRRIRILRTPARLPHGCGSRGRRRDRHGLSRDPAGQAGLPGRRHRRRARRWWPRPRPTPKEHGVTLKDTACVEWQKLPERFGEKAFDAIICLGNSLTHLFDHETRRDAVDAMYRALKPGGVIVIDHRNYDRMLDKGYSTKHSYYYTGGSVHVAPAVLNRTLWPHGLQVRETARSSTWTCTRCARST